MYVYENKSDASRSRPKILALRPMRRPNIPGE